MNRWRAENFSAVELNSTGNQELTPFFSIAVTTYDRRDLLKQTLESITSQTFSDFEVIIGNDNHQEPLSAGLLGIADPRIRLVNNPQNLGELENMNSLLRMSRGRYFTWQSDDDLYAPDFLEAVHSALVKFDFPRCVFTSYKTIDGTSARRVAKSFSGQQQLLSFSGRQFLRMYLSGKLKAMGCTGVMDIEYIRQMGGVKRLSESPFALYAEYVLLLHAGLQENIAYINAPLVFYRDHEGSWGCTSRDVDEFKQAGQNLVHHSVTVFKRPELRDHFYQNLSSILELPLSVLVSKLAARDGRVNKHEVMAYLLSLREQFKPLKGSVLYWLALAGLGRRGVGLVWSAAKSEFRSAAPPGLVKLARRLRSFLPGRERRPFWN